MYTFSFKKLSLLGLVLLTASAIAEAVIVKKTKETHLGDRSGKLQPSSVGGILFTCVPHILYNECTATGAYFTATTAAFTSMDFPTITNNFSSDAGLNTSVSG